MNEERTYSKYAGEVCIEFLQKINLEVIGVMHIDETLSFHLSFKKFT